MANSYTLAAFDVSVGTVMDRAKLVQIFDALSTYAQELDETALRESLEHIDPDGSLADKFSDSIQDIGESSYFEVLYDLLEDGSLWFRHDESMSDDIVATALQEWMAAYSIDGHISFSTAYICSKPRVGEFGGTSWIITSDGMYIDYGFTLDVVRGLEQESLDRTLASYNRAEVLYAFVAQDMQVQGRLVKYLAEQGEN